MVGVLGGVMGFVFACLRATEPVRDPMQECISPVINHTQYYSGDASALTKASTSPIGAFRQTNRRGQNTSRPIFIRSKSVISLRWEGMPNGVFGSLESTPNRCTSCSFSSQHALLLWLSRNRNTQTRHLEKHQRPPGCTACSYSEVSPGKPFLPPQKKKTTVAGLS